MVQITNHFDRALSLLVSQFRGQKPDGSLTNFQKLIKVLVKPFQDIENVKWQLKTERWLSSSEGVQLDKLGEILGLARLPGESDEEYRERLQFQIFINKSSGTPEEVMSVLRFFTQATHTNYHDIGIAAFQLETNGLKNLSAPDLPNDLNEGLFKVSPAGVNYAPIVATYGVDISFELSGDLTDAPFLVAPDILDPTDLTELLIEPNNALLYVAAGQYEQNGPDGGLDELDFPLATAGQVSELIQKVGNFPPQRF